MYDHNRIIRFLYLIFIFVVASCNSPQTKSLEVTATAYNSVKAQTNDNPSITAWGDKLEPGMKAIAISRDLLDSGFYHNMELTIDGLEGTYKVMDKMNRRWTKKIDIYMGVDVAKAREWGKKQVVIRWTPATEK
jgi:3D (Asp-Asp-Asp) domain-containing protein